MIKENELKPGVTPCSYCSQPSVTVINNIPVCSGHTGRIGVKASSDERPGLLDTVVQQTTAGKE